MEKEQKKILLVAVSVGVFLLVTVTVAIILITQRTQYAEAAVSWSNPVQPTFVQPLQPPVIEIPSDPVIVEIEEEKPIVDTHNGDSMTIRIPSPTAPAVPSTPEIVSVVPSVPVTPQVTQPATPPAAPRQTQAQTPRQTTTPARTTTASSSSRAAPPRTINDYWIQTGAFEARIRAEDAKDLLAEKGFISIIENREINGKVWYRVRLGPYTSQREADYWLTLVKSIDGFAQSQVRQTTRTQ